MGDMDWMGPVMGGVITLAIVDRFLPKVKPVRVAKKKKIFKKGKKSTFGNFENLGF
jgi:hypothetical protein